MGAEIREVKNLIAIGGLVALAYVVGFFSSFLFYPNDEMKRNIFVGIFVLVGALTAIGATLRRIIKGL